ncbi:hypothetical protein P3W43_01465 [Salinicola salarius]|uniref:hypothetical protein n=1 Tax=Salinicola salarius TaxID=430457 RepID=UPI0023E35A4E|nr:hypothetical protein [Salinicola salarius]MDF3917517.1 hypothetical protein [Salinicola salarius]
MPIKGGRNVRRNFARTVGRIAGPLTDRVVTEILIIGEGYAVNLTPVDTSNLINSRFRQVTSTTTGTKGVVAYTAEYAAAVHDGGEKNWQKAAAEDEFLAKGFQRDGRADIEAHIRRSYRQ